MLNSIKATIFNNAKNVLGWKTNRKLIAFAVDDYGNVRVDSKKAREAMTNAGLKIYSRFDYYDTLETETDLTALFEVLTSVKDKHGQAAIFTPYALPANINFEAILDQKSERYQYELLPETFNKLKGYASVNNLWQEGIENKIFMPEFHGREHLHIKTFEEALKRKDKGVKICLQNRSYTSLKLGYFPNVKYSAAFDFSELDENENFKSILADGLNTFETVFGYRSCSFTPPSGNSHVSLESTLVKNGIKILDQAFKKKEHQGKGVFKLRYNHTGQKRESGLKTLVRNCQFEPTDFSRNNWVQHALNQIEAAFYWHKPAIISSHRVNFCGHIDPENRKTGLHDLKTLLDQIVQRWPTAEFVSIASLNKIMANN